MTPHLKAILLPKRSMLLFTRILKGNAGEGIHKVLECRNPDYYRSVAVPAIPAKLTAQYFFNSPLQAKSCACSFGTSGVLIAKHCRGDRRRLHLKGQKEEMKRCEGKMK